MEQNNCVEVVIDGEVYKLISSETEDHIQKVANYINKKISDVYKNCTSPTINTQMKFLILTINVADDYIKLQNNHSGLIKENEKEFSEKNMVESENHILRQKVKIMQAELDAANDELKKARRELEEYIENFEDENRKGI